MNITPNIIEPIPPQQTPAPPPDDEGELLYVRDGLLDELLLLDEEELRDGLDDLLGLLYLCPPPTREMLFLNEKELFEEGFVKDLEGLL